MWPIILALLFVNCNADRDNFPPGLEQCRRSDPNLSQCFGKTLGKGLSLFANGSKYYGMPQLDPFYIKELVLKGDPSKAVYLEQKYINAYFSGMVNSNTEKVLSFNIDDDDKCGYAIDVFSPFLKMEADYEITGKLLMFPLNSQGKCNMTLNNFWNLHTMTCKRYIKDGKTHISFTSYKMDMRADNIVFYFSNLFPENEQIGAEILKTINENSINIFNEVKGGFEKVFSDIHLVMGNKFFNKEPLETIFLD